MQTIYNPPCLGEDTSSSSSTSKATLGRRQFSQTQSEPETTDLPASASGQLAQQPSFDRSVTFTEPKIKVIPPSGRGSLLMHMHSEYASITDELETVCGLLSPPKSPGLLSPPRPEQSPPSKWRRRRCTHCFVIVRWWMSHFIRFQNDCAPDYCTVVVIDSLTL